MRLETARHPSRKWSGTYLGSLVPSVNAVNFFRFRRETRTFTCNIEY